MPTPRETILAALHARLLTLPATALRGEMLPERVPAEGLLILRDGEPGEPEVTLSPLRYHYQHRAEIEAIVQGAERDTAFDMLIASIGTALTADRTLGGLCDWVEAEAPRPVDLPVDGAASLKAAVVPFGLQGQVILDRPQVIALIAVPILIQSYGIFALAYAAAYAMPVPHRIAAPCALIGTSNFFELAVAVAISLFGLNSGAALATVVGVLVEVPVMLSLVAFANRTRARFA